MGLARGFFHGACPFMTTTGEVDMEQWEALKCSNEGLGVQVEMVVVGGHLQEFLFCLGSDNVRQMHTIGDYRGLCPQAGTVPSR